MAQTATTETLPEITNIDTGRSAFNQLPDTEKFDSERPTVVVHFNTGAKVAYTMMKGFNTVDIVWYHPLCPEIPIDRRVLVESPEREGVYGEAMKWVAEYLEISSQDDLYDQLGERMANILLGREVMTGLDIFE